MLAADKNQLVAGVRKHALEIREKELRFFVERYTNLATQASVVAGFAFDGLVELVHATADNAAATDTHRVPAVLGARLREARASPSLCFERLT